MTRSPRSSPERRLLPAFLLAGAALLLAAPAGAQPEAAGSPEVQARVEAVLSDPRFQRELPAHEARERDSSRYRRAGTSRGGEVSSEPSVVVPVIGAGALLAKTVFVILAIVAVLLLLSWLGGEIARRRRALRNTGAAAAGPADLQVAEREPTHDDAARLAAEGRYGEAIHALLLAAIRYYAERSRVSVQPSRTSRELIRLLPLGAETREAFAELVRAVEPSLFGGVAVGAEDYERSLSRFRLLTRSPA